MGNRWSSTGTIPETTYNDIVTQALLFQVGEDDDYMPANQIKDEGNDDQVFWAFAALTAAELNFPNPSSDEPQWLALAQAVFNTQVTRWDSITCGGGLRWQIFAFNGGYNYKNTIANSGFFQLAARLARYTSNSTYEDDDGTTYQVNDGSSTTTNCSNANTLQWTYNYGTLISDSAYMYNYTNGSSVWQDRLQALLNGADVFFPSAYGGKIISEIECEPDENCNYDQPSFKAYLSRWMAIASQLAPFTATNITTKLRASAAGAAGQCSGGDSGQECGRRWYQSSWDGYTGVGEQMSALSVIMANLISLTHPSAPLTADTGGNSTGDPGAGAGSGVVTSTINQITTREKIAAGFLTTSLLCTLGGGTWMILGE